jgi:hypothetical protein
MPGEPAYEFSKKKKQEHIQELISSGCAFKARTSYIASSLHHLTMHHICMDILVYIAGTGSFKPGYIIQISNSQHGWIFHYGCHNQHWMIEVFKAPSE